ncbi:hypothetical protein IFM89_038271 [Coptis chinensis]|uniref:DUF295 domain-containing protein n=1 Tax=Coptis chinensis TaxID=261450 RepID=A0A835LH15_9MAGN|nr:hypothetical protein IFM89_038271 [Coptis chinensis]
MHALFLGINTSATLLASDCSSQIRKNYIYFTDCYDGRRVGDDIGVFNLEDQFSKPLYTSIPVTSADSAPFGSSLVMDETGNLSFGMQ